MPHISRRPAHLRPVKGVDHETNLSEIVARLPVPVQAAQLVKIRPLAWWYRACLLRWCGFWRRVRIFGCIRLLLKCLACIIPFLPRVQNALFALVKLVLVPACGPPRASGITTVLLSAASCARWSSHVTQGRLVRLGLREGGRAGQEPHLALSGKERLPNWA